MSKYTIVRNTTNNPYLLQFIEKDELVTKELNQGDTFEYDINKAVENKDFDNYINVLYSEYYGHIEEVDFKYPTVDQAKGSTFIAVKDDGKTKEIVQDKINEAVAKYRTLIDTVNKPTVKK